VRGSDGAIPSCCTSVPSPTWTLLSSHRGHLRRIRDDDERDDGGGGGGGGSASTTTSSLVVAAHAWLNARLTNVFAFPDHRSGGGGGDDDDDDGVKGRP
jgi:hypothetical protein